MSNPFIPTAELDFLEYRTSLKEYLKSQSIFTDYDFEGSNMSVLLDLLAYNTTFSAFYENMIGSEMFLDSAQLKSSAISKAKELNYLPKSRTSARTTVSISVATNGDHPSTITIPKNYVLTSNSVTDAGSTITYSFVTESPTIIQPDSFYNYVATDVDILQGLLVKEVFVANTDKRYILQANTIDIDTISVTVTDDSNSQSTWSRANTIFGLTSTSQIYFIQPYINDQYEIFFGNDVLGKSVKNGSSINVSYLSTTGADGNDLSVFSPSVAVDGYEVSSIIAEQKTYGGSEREDLNTIKLQAPRWFQTQERAIIEADYETFVRENYATIQSVRAYGGEKLDPPQYGKVAIFLKPYGSFGVAPDKLKQKIVTDLTSKNMLNQVIIKDPEYFYSIVESTVYYDPNLLTSTVRELETIISSSIAEYTSSILTDFDSDLRYSKVVKEIDSVSDAIVSNDTTLKLSKRWKPVTGSESNLSFSFGTSLFTYGTTEVLLAGIDRTISTSVFTHLVNSVPYQCRIIDDGLGSLDLIVNNTDMTILKKNIGSVSYESGNISLSVNISTYSSHISIYAKPAIKDLVVTENRFLIQDPSEILIKAKKYVS